MIEALVAGAGSLLGGLFGSSGAKKAARAQERAAQQQLELQREMFGRQQEFMTPYQQAGLTGQNELMRLLGIGGDRTSAGYGSLAQPFSQTQFEADPGYGFRMAEGMKALERSAAARGGLLSGAALKGIQRYGQDLASQEYQNAFQRYQDERQARYAPLQNLLASGQSAAGALSGAAGGFGAAGGQALADVGAARASGYVGQTNALQQALAGGVNALQYGLASRQPNLQPYQITGAAANRMVAPMPTMAVDYRTPGFGDMV